MSISLCIPQSNLLTEKPVHMMESRMEKARSNQGTCLSLLSYRNHPNNEGNLSGPIINEQTTFPATSRQCSAKHTNGKRSKEKHHELKTQAEAAKLARPLGELELL